MPKSSIQAAGEAMSSPEISLNEPAVNIPIALTGIRAIALGGMAHLAIYVEQPDVNGNIENIIVARATGPLERVKMALLSAVERLSQAMTLPASDEEKPLFN